MRPTAILPQKMIDQLLFLHEMNRDWLTIKPEGDNGYGYGVYHDKRAHGNVLLNMCETALERAELLLFSRFFGDGPKVFVPTEQQCDVFEQVEINLHPNDYTQPFEAMCVTLPKGRYFYFNHVLLLRLPTTPAIVVLSATQGRDMPIDEWLANVTTQFYGETPHTIEHYLSRYDDATITKEEQDAVHKAFRVAMNCALALSNFGCHAELMYAKEYNRDASLAKEKSERGLRAKKRLALAVQQIAFTQEVKLYKDRRSEKAESVPTGSSMPCHWRRGHWAMTPCGPKHSERKRVFRAPVLVRADLLTGSKSNTSVTYHT